MLAKIKPYLTCRYLLYFYALTASWPCVLSFMGWLPSSKTGMMIIAVLSVLYAIKQRGRVPSSIKTIFIVQLVTFFLYSFIHSDSSYITRCVVLITAYSLIVVQAKRSKMEFVNTNIFWLTLQAAMGGIGFVLTLVGILKPFSTFIEFDGHVGQFYGLYTTTVALDGVFRVAGFFDEPGAFAFWGFIALLLNKLYFDNKKIEVILIIGLISTLSMAYFIQLPIYLFLFYRKRFGKMILPVILLFLILRGIASLSPQFNQAIFGRFQVDKSTGKLEGDNRTEHGEFCKAIWVQSPVVGVGGNQVIAISLQEGQFAGSNPYTFLATDGVVGYVILLLPLFYIFSLGRRKRKYTYVGILLALGLLQRPYDPTQLLYPLIFFTICFEGYRDVYLFSHVRISKIDMA
jgi:hypothetical protein